MIHRKKKNIFRYNCVLTISFLLNTPCSIFYYENNLTLVMGFFLYKLNRLTYVHTLSFYL